MGEQKRELAAGFAFNFRKSANLIKICACQAVGRDRRLGRLALARLGRISETMESAAGQGFPFGPSAAAGRTGGRLAGGPAERKWRPARLMGERRCLGADWSRSILAD